MRHRLAMLAAALGGIGALAPLRLLGGESSEYHEDDGALVAGFVVVAVLSMAVPLGLTVAFAYGRLSQRWAVSAVVAFVVSAVVVQWAVFYLGYLAALVLGLAIAAGEPLPPPDPGDDRLHRPFPGPSGYER